MNLDDRQDMERAQAYSKARIAEFLRSLDPAIDQRDDAIAQHLENENASAKLKLKKIYALVSDVSTAAAPYVACKRGCSSCCEMNVSITSVEAQTLASVTGRHMVQVSRTPKHASDRFAGVPCPFLVEGVCSVYDVRPYACRAHFSFDTSAYWCHPERAYAGQMGQLGLEGAARAYRSVASKTSLRGFADIRDFFPAVGEGLQA